MKDQKMKDQMHYEHPFKVEGIDLIFELNWLSYAYEGSQADLEFVNLDVTTQNVWLSSDVSESSVYVLWEGGTSQENIRILAARLYENYENYRDSLNGSVSIGIFEDTNGKRHALLSDLYKKFKKSCYWLPGYKHIACTDRTNLDSRQIKALIDAKDKVAKLGMFDLVANGWTLQGDVAMTDKQCTKRSVELEKQCKRLKSWDRSMKRMGLMPSAAGVILGEMSQNS